MASRLDRLVLLLDTGSASGIRSTAAQQLGDIMRQHPNELRNLLNRVSVHLCSQNWETRIAAGQAIGAIAKNTTYWNAEVKIEDLQPPNLDKKSALSFKELDINAVMKNGKQLLGSAGKEYDVEINNMTVEERLNFFRKDLKKRLGLEAELLDDLIDDDDVIFKHEPAIPKVESPTNEIDMSALSARERNRLKRKNKRDLKDKANEARKRVDSVKKKTVDSQIIANDSKDDKVVIESKVLLTEAVDPRDWPFEDFCESLCLDLFDPNWTVRHGAAIGLREILKHHGDNAGKIAGLSADFNTKFHDEWLEDVCVRLLCVLVLDRFCDFVSDQAVAPVRETCSQTLGTLLRYAPESIVMKTQECLLHFIFNTGKDGSDHVRWESRHAGLLGLKYLVAVRTDLVHKLMDGTVTAVLAGLQDNDDDVVAISASALLPITQSLVDLLPNRVVEIISLLWRCMSNVKDDLSASTGSIMDLIAKLFSYPHVLQSFKDLAMVHPQYSLHNLVPILFPFFRHTISSVRMAVLTTLKLFTEADHKGGWIDARILRLVFQNLIVEEKPNILHESEALWHLIMAKLALEPSQYYEIIRSCVPSWLNVLMTPLGAAINDQLFFLPKAATSEDQSGLEMAHNIDIAILTSDFSLIHPDIVVRNRLISAKAFGHLMQVLPLDEIALLFDGSLRAYIQSTWGIHQQLSAVIVEAWFTGNQAIHNQMELKQSIMTMLLSQIEANVATTFQETVPHLKRLRGECLALINTAVQEGGADPNHLPTFPATVLGETDDGFNIAMAQSLAQLTIDSIIPIVNLNCQRNLSDRRDRILTSIGTVQNFVVTIETQVSSAISCGLIALEILPPKLNPIVRSVMNSIKSEATLELQTRSAHGLAKLVFLCSQPDATTNPTAKIVKNLSAFLCSDVDTTPIFNDNPTKFGIYTLLLPPFNQGRAKTKAEVETVENGPKLIRRGAELCFEQFCKVIGAELFIRIPKLWEIIYVQQQHLLSQSVDQFNLAIQTEPKLGQELIDSLQVISKLIPFVDPVLLPYLHPILPWVTKALLSQFSIIRFVAARCLSALSDRMLSACMNELITNGLPYLSDLTSVTNRQGLVEAVYYILTTLDTKILPYVIFMVVPVLGRMSDNNDAVRLLASNCFALLINLIPLESGIPDPPDIAPELVAQRITERKFLSQLLDNSQVENYKLPVKINAELRSYQQEGVNWLAFLNKYQLHGILCDDMGLGKTLQSICILASDHHVRKTRYEETQLPDAAHLPSLVICPPTLIGHWFHEIQNYVGNLQPFIYSGTSIERKKIRHNLTTSDVVVTSYDIVRNDIEALEPIQFNYCILDEGHIIKNTKTKLTKAVKSLKANHRLILSGTPIQNNVLELWSLFDFLMPGFLGTEKSFNERYSRPILASREAKSSSKEQESGALALEALHKQVLPFLLRRLKEDVLDDLPPKIIQDYYCDLGEIQKQLYEDFAKSKHSPGAEVDGNGDVKSNTKSSHVFQSLQYMRKLCNHPLLVLTEKHPKYQQISNRPGGLESLKELHHAPKLLALKQLLNDCGIGTRSDTTEDSLITSTVSQHRVLIFCQLKSMLDLVEHELLKHHLPTVSYLRLDGSIDHMERHKMVQKFNSDPSIDLLLLTTHIGGLGLNLTGADTVIFVEHDWNPMKDLQAMDRAHRIGQKKVVNVYRLISRGTLEEKIMGLQKFKLNIANSVVNQQNSGLGSMDTDQLLDLFKPPTAATTVAATATDTDATGQPGALGSNFKQALEGIEKLWDEKQYDEEFDLNQFIDGLKNE